MSTDLFRQVAAAARRGGPGERSTADFLTAFGTDAAPVEGEIADTDFRTMSGAGHQHFLGFMRQLAGETASDHLRSALLEAWRYDDPRPSMRWDANDDRRYALRAADPADGSQSPIRTVRGANRLAVEALPAFPTNSARGQVRTRGFTRTGSVLGFTWPIWNEPLSWPAVRVLVGHPELLSPGPRKSILQEIGVVDVFRCRRINVDRYRNFTPAVSCWGAVTVG